MSAQVPLVDVVEEGQGDDDEADILVVNETVAGPVRAQPAAGQGALVRNILEAEKALQVRGLGRTCMYVASRRCTLPHGLT